MTVIPSGVGDSHRSLWWKNGCTIRDIAARVVHWFDWADVVTRLLAKERQKIWQPEGCGRGGHKLGSVAENVCECVCVSWRKEEREGRRRCGWRDKNSAVRPCCSLSFSMSQYPIYWLMHTNICSFPRDILHNPAIVPQVHSCAHYGWEKNLKHWNIVIFLPRYDIIHIFCYDESHYAICMSKLEKNEGRSSAHFELFHILAFTRCQSKYHYPSWVSIPTSSMHILFSSLIKVIFPQCLLTFSHRFLQDTSPPICTFPAGSAS